MKKNLSLLLVFIFTLTIFGADIPMLVIDSGTDFSHSVIRPYGLADNGVAGYEGDTYGWNFAEGNNELVNLSYTPPRYDDLLTFMEIMGKFQVGGKDALTEAEFNFLLTNYYDQKFMEWAGFLGGWAHGTHVGGTMVQQTEGLKLKAIKHLPTGAAPSHISDIQEMLEGLVLQQQTRRSSAVEQTPSMADFIAYFDSLGADMIKEVAPMRDYIGALNPRVINCSFGSDNESLFAMFKNNMVNAWGFVNPTDAQVQEMVNLFVTRAFLPRDKEMFAKAENALIVIAAGNSGNDLENIACSPNNVAIPNKIVVAATHEDKALAPFSDYARTKVDVAVPGVNIYATYPNQKMGYMSGTSMAAPLVSQYAGLVFAKNPALSPTDVKGILMGTVDRKPWLAEKVRSGGVVNIDRAVRAAELVKEGKTLGQAIAISRREVMDKEMPTRSGVAVSPLPVFETQVERDIYFSLIF